MNERRRSRSCAPGRSVQTLSLTMRETFGRKQRLRNGCAVDRRKFSLSLLQEIVDCQRGGWNRDVIRFRSMSRDRMSSEIFFDPRPPPLLAGVIEELRSFRFDHGAVIASIRATRTFCSENFSSL